MKALYRKYRPKTLGEVVGQKQVTEPLENALKSDKISHAYLFIGPRGCGKTSVARIFAHAVNDFDYEIEDNYVDIIEIDGASNRGIDNIRDLREKVMIAPTTGKYKIYIIDEVHMLTKEAFNALLKTLEEPPKHAIFILATTDAYKVPVTITSRAQTYTFKLADSATMLDFLRSVASAEKIAIDDEALKVIAKRGGGSFRDSLSLLDQISTLSDKKITKEQVVTAMGLPQDEKIAELLNNYIAGDVVKITTLLKELLASGVKPETLTEEIIAQIVENPRPELLGLLSKLTDVRAPFAEAKLIVALCDNVRVAGNMSQSSGMSFSGPTSAPSTSYAGTPGKVAQGATFSGPSEIYVSERENRKMSVKKTSPDALTKPTSGETVGPQKSMPDRTRTADATSENRKMSVKKTSPDALVKPTSGETVGPQKSMPDGTRTTDVNDDSIKSTPSDFNWNDFIQKVKTINGSAYYQLIKASYELNGNTLDIYPGKRIIKTTLMRSKEALSEAAGGQVKITIHDEKDTPKNAKKDELLSKISDIMGGEVRDDEGGNPFE